MMNDFNFTLIDLFVVFGVPAKWKLFATRDTEKSFRVDSTDHPGSAQHAKDEDMMRAKVQNEITKRV